MPEIGNVTVRVDAVITDEQYHEAMDAVRAANERMDLIEVENIKLRELAEDMMRFFEDGDWCTTCEQACKCESQEQYEEDCLMRDVFHHRMRELGVG